MIETTDEPPEGGGSTATSSDSERPDSGKRKKGRTVAKEFSIMAVCALVLAILIKTFLVQAFWIPSASMYPTLARGDRVLVNRLPYHPEIGNVIVFKNPRLPAETDRSAIGGAAHWLQQLVGFSLPKDEYLIKRVIGLPGDTVKVAGDGTYVNGTKLSEPYRNTGGPGLTGEWHVPEGSVFVMGDNRAASEDSRFIGSIPIDTIVGRAFVKIWPPSRAGGL